MTQSDSKNKFEKKTERLDVRLSHQKKKAFSEACENQGDTPSNAVRRFINSYIRRSNRDDIGAVIRGKLKGKGHFIISGLTVLLAAVYLVPRVMSPNLVAVSKEALFTHYDYDKSGLLELAEISPNDEHLHRVLNIDGEPGISFREFDTHGTMKWSYFNPDKDVVLENTVKNSAFGTHRRKITIVSSLPGGKLPENAMIPTGNPDKPFMTLDEFKALDKPISDVQNLDISPEVRRAAWKKFPPTQTIKSTYVIFDLRDTNRFQIDVLEQTSHAMTSKSMRYLRSVEWIRGETSPHFVMGKDQDWWQSLQN